MVNFHFKGFKLWHPGPMLCPIPNILCPMSYVICQASYFLLLMFQIPYHMSSVQFTMLYFLCKPTRVTCLTPEQGHHRYEFNKDELEKIIIKSIYVGFLSFLQGTNDHILKLQQYHRAKCSNQ